MLHASGKEESACEDRDIFDLSLINKGNIRTYYSYLTILSIHSFDFNLNGIADTARKEKVNVSVDIAEDLNLHTPLLSVSM